MFHIRHCHGTIPAYIGKQFIRLPHTPHFTPSPLAQAWRLARSLNQGTPSANAVLQCQLIHVLFRCLSWREHLQAYTEALLSYHLTLDTVLKTIQIARCLHTQLIRSTIVHPLITRIGR